MGAKFSEVQSNLVIIHLATVPLPLLRHFRSSPAGINRNYGGGKGTMPLINLGTMPRVVGCRAVAAAPQTPQFEGPHCEKEPQLS